MTERDILIAAIVTLWASIVALAAYVKYLHDKHAKEQKTNLIMMTEEMHKSRTAIENNTKVTDKVFESIQKATKK